MWIVLLTFYITAKRFKSTFFYLLVFQTRSWIKVSLHCWRLFGPCYFSEYSSQVPDSNPGLLGKKRKRFLCVMPSHPLGKAWKYKFFIPQSYDYKVLYSKAKSLELTLATIRANFSHICSDQVRSLRQLTQRVVDLTNDTFRQFWINDILERIRLSKLRIECLWFEFLLLRSSTLLLGLISGWKVRLVLGLRNTQHSSLWCAT